MTTPIPDELADVLQKTGIAHLASLGPDGEPQSHPVWFHWSNGTLRLSTLRGRQKLKNVERDARIAVSITDPDSPTRYLELRGHATVEADEDRSFVNLLAKRYLGQDEYPWDAPDAQRVIISLEPEHVTTMGA